MTGRRASVLLAIALTSVAGAAGAELDIQGHRGCAGLMPENTLPAFERAIELGVTTLELDLQVTRDRVVIVSHDQRPTGHCRYADGREAPGGLFKDLDHADLAGLECGSKHGAEGAHIPTLDEVLRLAREADYPVRVSVEIKLQKADAGIPVDEFARLVVDRLRAAEMETRAIVQSFDPAVLRAVAELAPKLKLSVIVRKPGRYDDALEESGATILSPKHGALREADVARLQERGIEVIPWTVNAPADIRRVLGLGVDGVISDYPDRVIAIRDEMRR